MIEKHINGRISPQRLSVEDKMVKADLIHKYLQVAEESARRRQMRAMPQVRDTLPDERSVPSDVPEGTIGATPGLNP